MFMLSSSIFEKIFTEKFPKSVEIFVDDLLQIYASAAKGEACRGQMLYSPTTAKGNKCAPSERKLVAKLRDFLGASEIVRLVLSKRKNCEFVYLSVETQMLVGPNEEFTTDGRLYPLYSGTNLSILCITLQIIGSNGSRKIEEFKLDEYESFDGIDRFILLEVRISGRKGKHEFHPDFYKSK